MLCRILASLAALTLLPAAASAGSLDTRAFDSAALGGPLTAMVYTPDGNPPVGGWPVVYLLHGHGGTERSWTDLGDIEATLDRLMGAEGSLDPALVVMPRAENSWYVDSRAVGGPGDYETALARDLRLAIEADYPVRTDRAGRSIAGLSMGGFGALRLGLSYPELYTVAASLSGAIWQNVPADAIASTPDELKAIQNEVYLRRTDAATLTAGVILPSVGDHYDGAFGTPFDARLFNRQNVFTLLAARIGERAALPAFYIACGDDDGFGLWRGAVALYTQLKAEGHVAQLRITDGDHRWSVWADQVVDALAYIDAERKSAEAKVADAPTAPKATIVPAAVTVEDAAVQIRQ